MVGLQELSIDTEWPGFDSRSQLRANDLLGQGWRASGRGLWQASVMRFDNDPLKTPADQTVFGDQTLLSGVDPQPAILGFLQQQHLPSVGSRDRIDVAPILDRAVPCRPPVGDLAGVEACARQRLQVFLPKAADRRNPRGTMNAHVSHALQPFQDLTVEVWHIHEVRAHPKALLDIANAALDFAFGLSTIRL